jgi:ACDE family multidrug resistance protein
VSVGSVPWRSPTFHVILASSLMGVMGVSLISPTLPAVRRALALTDPQVSLLLTAFSVPGIVLAPLIGVLADRYGRRAVLVPCLVGYGVTGGSIVVVGEFDLILLLRAVQGGAASGLVTLAVTLIGDTFGGARRNQLMGINGAAISVGTAAYPLLGGALAELSWTAPFALYLLGVPVGLLALRALPGGSGGEARGLGYFGDVLAAVPTRRTVVVYGTYVVVFAVLYGAVLTALPLVLARQYGLSSFGVGLVLTASSVATGVVSTLNGRLALRLSGDRLVALGFVAYGVGLGGVWLARSPVEVAVAILGFGAGMGLVIPSLDSITSSLADREFRGGVTSFRTSAIRIGQTVGPPVFTTAAVVAGYRPLLLVAAAVTLALGAATSVLTRRGGATPDGDG